MYLAGISVSHENHFFIKKSKKKRNFKSLNFNISRSFWPISSSKSVSESLNHELSFDTFWRYFQKIEKGANFSYFLHFFYHKFLLRPFCAKFKNRKKRISISRKFFVFFFNFFFEKILTRVDYLLFCREFMVSEISKTWKSYSEHIFRTRGWGRDGRLRRGSLFGRRGRKFCWASSPSSWLIRSCSLLRLRNNLIPKSLYI